MSPFEVVELCAGAGGQALGLAEAGFEHALAVELDKDCCNTLRENRPEWKVREGDVADTGVWRPGDYEGVSLLAGGVPCPPFSIAGKQLGVSDERDLLAWAVEQVAAVKPRALLLENVRGLSLPRFAGYRQHVLDRLSELGYAADWRLLHASDYNVPQLRPRFILVALGPEDAPYFYWPSGSGIAPTAGQALGCLMGSRGWEQASSWAVKANRIAPTIVGGSKKHGGADLGPTRARQQWARMGVNASSVADHPPAPGDDFPIGPRLTIDMVARIQGWSEQYPWRFMGGKTARYRQIGNAFPPPVAHAVGSAILGAFRRDRNPRPIQMPVHDSLYQELRSTAGFATKTRLMQAIGAADETDLDRRLALLSHDFSLETDRSGPEPAYRLGKFLGFVGQQTHHRQDAIPNLYAGIH